MAVEEAEERAERAAEAWWQAVREMHKTPGASDLHSLARVEMIRCKDGLILQDSSQDNKADSWGECLRARSQSPASSSVSGPVAGLESVSAPDGALSLEQEQNSADLSDLACSIEEAASWQHSQRTGSLALASALHSTEQRAAAGAAVPSSSSCHSSSSETEVSESEYADQGTRCFEQPEPVAHSCAAAAANSTRAVPGFLTDANANPSNVASTSTCAALRDADLPPHSEGRAELHEFHNSAQGHASWRPSCWIAGRQVDLAQLVAYVDALGGATSVTASNRWPVRPYLYLCTCALFSLVCGCVLRCLCLDASGACLQLLA